VPDKEVEERDKRQIKQDVVDEDDWLDRK